MYLPEKGYQRILVLSFYLLLAFCLIYVVFNYLMNWLMPFVIGWFIAFLIQKPIRFLKKKLRFPKKLSSLILILAIITVIITLSGLLIDRIVTEIDSFFSFLSANMDGLTKALTGFFDDLPDMLSKIPFAENLNLDGFGNEVRDSVTASIIDLTKTVVTKLPQFAANVASLMPSILIFLVILLISSYYLASDFHKINSFILCQFNEKTRRFLQEFKKLFLNTITKYLRAYLLIMLITFTELYFGLTVLRIKYAFLIALTISVIDLLPILGSGSILVPWAIISFLQGNVVLGVELLALYVIITFVRQIIEPKIVGSFIGLHPLVSLMTMFLGLSLMGIWGMFLFPITTIVLKIMNDNGTVHLWNVHPENTKKETAAGAVKPKKKK